MTGKLLGGALLLSVGALAAYQRSRAERQRLAVLDAWIDLLLALRAEIDRYLTPIDRFFARADKRTLQTLGNAGAKSLAELIPHTLPFLTADVQKQLSDFARDLGDCYREEQIRRCEDCITSIRRYREAVASELPARHKIGITMSLSAALGLVILLW